MRKLLELTRSAINNPISKFLLATRKRKIIFLVLLLAIVAWKVNNANKPDWELDVIRVKKQTLEENISASGKVDAVNLAELSFLTSENIKEIAVENGSYVKKGDLIAKLDSTSLYQSYLQAESNLRATEANVNSIYDSLQNKETTETFAEINTRTTAEVARDNAYRAFVIAQKNLSNTVLRAPFDGILNYNSKTSIGKLATSLSPTFTIVDPKTVYFSAEIGETDITKVAIGTPVRLEIDAYPDKIFEEKVTSIGYINTFTSTGGTAYKIRVSLPDNTNNMFRVGMNGDAEFILSITEDTFSVPQSSIVEENGNTYVWTVDNNKRVSKLEVETGRSSINNIEILSGLDTGVLIITRPPSKMKKGQKIKIKNQEQVESGSGIGKLSR